MAIERVGAERVAVDSVRALGLDPSSIGLTFEEGLAASLRRAASFRCPTTPGALVRSTAEVLAGLPGFSDSTSDEIESLVDLLVSYGDLLELHVDTDSSGRRRQLFLGPPSYVARASDVCLLIGIRPDGAPLVSDELLEHIEYEGHVRRLRSTGARTAREMLDAEGLVQMNIEHWLKAPRSSTPSDLARVYLERLDTAPEVHEIEGLRIMDTAARVTYYKGRWRPLRSSDRGHFVARRPQAFGADLWCVALAEPGSLRVVDLPLDSRLDRGSDEAWRLQAAFDALAGHPQRVRKRAGAHANETVLEFFSPVPSWLQRGLDALGRPLPGVSGALFAYAIPADEVAEEEHFLNLMLWTLTDAT